MSSATKRSLKEQRANQVPIGSVLNVNVPIVFRPLEEHQGRFFGAYGGRGSAKSHYFARRLIRRCLKHPGTRAVCLREVQESLRESVKALLDNLIAKWRLWLYFRPLRDRIDVLDGRGRVTGVIVFQGLLGHTADSIKSLEDFDIAWVEEAHTVSKRSWNLLRPTIRKPGSQIWCSWNPHKPTDPVDEFFRGPNPHKRALAVRATFRHNPWLSTELREEMEHDFATDKDKYANVWLGQYLTLTSARVFKNWRVGAPHEFDAKPAIRLYGVDWGFATDPSVMIEGYIKGRNLYITREVYGLHIEVDHLPLFFGGLADRPLQILNKTAYLDVKDKVKWEGIPGARDWPITADSARPDHISYMKRHGFPQMRPAKKGPGSVEEGVKFVQGYNIIVHPSCVHTIDELTLYGYKIDKHTEAVLPVLEDRDNHVIDALRYAVEHLRVKGRVGVLW